VEVVVVVVVVARRPGSNATVARQSCVVEHHVRGAAPGRKQLRPEGQGVEGSVFVQRASEAVRPHWRRIRARLMHVHVHLGDAGDGQRSNGEHDCSCSHGGTSCRSGPA